MIYEVNNTFGGRHSYVIPVGPGVGARAAPSTSIVSPFNAVEGDYGFRFSAPAEKHGAGHHADCRQDAGAQGLCQRQRASRSLIAICCAPSSRIPFLTFKVIGAIHWQAVQLLVEGSAPEARTATAARTCR